MAVSTFGVSLDLQDITTRSDVSSIICFIHYGLDMA